MSPFVSVVVAFSAAWLMLALWVMRIGRRVNALLEAEHQRSGEA